MSPIGVAVEQFWQGAIEGWSGIRELSHSDGSAPSTGRRIAGEVSDFNADWWMGGVFGRRAGALDGTPMTALIFRR